MTRLAKKVRMPTISVFLPIDSTEDDARDAASDMIQNELGCAKFEIMHVQLEAEGEFRTNKGIREGKRYKIAFRKIHGEVVYVDPDFDRILRESAGY